MFHGRTPCCPSSARARFITSRRRPRVQEPNGLRGLFIDPAFGDARRLANAAMGCLRRHGPFEPHRVPPEDLESTSAIPG
ncbi:fructose 1,6-bisphosphatase [Streptomyces sp. NPDC018000]|uniref:fructose 1,6-bisphosphatase n=1 Tax=Streptomyces sp. NPDC018000 TaxID=3365028 RepID=UPI0037A4FCE6